MKFRKSLGKRCHRKSDVIGKAKRKEILVSDLENNLYEHQLNFNNFSQSLRTNFQVAKTRNKKDEDSIQTTFNKKIVN